jgi:hypothetical protein
VFSPGIWWIHSYAGGKRHREKVGRKSDAIDLYRSRKADASAGRKLPDLRNSKVVTLAELIDDALEFVANHKDKRNYESKAMIVRAALGSRPAAEMTPQELERWLRGHCKTSATSNRYKAFISLCYREGTVTRFAPGLLWREPPSKRFRKLPDTRRSQCPPVTAICLQPTNFPWWSESQERPPNSHLRANVFEAKNQ